MAYYSLPIYIIDDGQGGTVTYSYDAIGFETALLRVAQLAYLRPKQRIELAAITEKDGWLELMVYEDPRIRS